ncbi:ATP-dependent Clp protease ATP-binding subunit [Chitinivibrio alkaliphilus]|uniref:ATP-dependent Clp protease, ATPase subunit n=1 Tax=Chitinivibrio alkaliphilus ACht1 TaxID=1313304 RepID=U7DCZ3_9BACT|nr:ATP-dependent Clp protease ATP-binding subunit [Chitinivibrio alkaliphilus]ERP38766.1 ATP-dependent Clp protease, ATPase subunit [Chitinivibrio alkaliphilus ACht1]
MDGMFTDRVKKVMQIAREESVRLGNDYVGTEHLLLGVIKEGDGVAVAILKSLKVEIADIARDIEESLKSTGGMMTIGQMLPFTPRAKKVLENAAVEARNMSHKYVGTEHLLLALIKDTESSASATLTAKNVTYDVVKMEIAEVLKDTQSTGGAKSSSPRKSKTPFLDKFGRNLNQAAKEGRLDPVIGRKKEIERIIQILSRRKKNNPLLIGEPGIGKTAIVEGLAQKIIDKDIPEALEEKIVFSLDMASIVAGTKYRGQFEERVKSLITELTRNSHVIIFIDEIHTIVGAGGSEGSLDASNIFKPALARGEIQCVGATTLDEYRNSIESDGALDRRFQSIMVDPPSAEETVHILKGLQKKYEEHHKVTYTEKAILAAVRMSDRYISDRFLPDKAIDMIDESGARKRLSSMEIPPEIRKIEIDIDATIRDKEKSVSEQNFEEAARLRDRQDELKEQLEQKKIEWRSQVAETRFTVDEEVIAEVIASITGVPVSSLKEEESQRLLHLEEHLGEHVIGQGEALNAVARSIRRSRAGLHNINRPIASFIFLGPTGVGKTELAKQLAFELFDSEEALIRIDMSEYMEKFAASRLVGAPPGYVGYEEGGQLTEKVRKKPYSVILFDEIEKAHPDVFNILLQILDDGVATDSYGRTINFKNAIIIMTSNAGTRGASKGQLGFTSGGNESEYEVMKSKVMDQLKKIFTPEFLNRVDETIVFRPLGREVLSQIVENKLAEVEERLEERDIYVSFTESVREFILDRGFDREQGARPIQRAIQRNIEDILAEEFLKGYYGENDKIEVYMDNETIRIENKDAYKEGALNDSEDDHSYTENTE